MSSKVVNQGEFKVLEVASKVPIKKFLESEKLKFNRGLAYYELTKKELIQDYKQVVVRRKSDGLIVEGEDVRPILNIPKASKSKVEIDTDSITDFEIFVQSTSYNRALFPGTKLLYRAQGFEEETTIPESESISTNTRQTRASKRVAVSSGDADATNSDTSTAKSTKRCKAAVPVVAKSKEALALTELVKPSDASGSEIGNLDGASKVTTPKVSKPSEPPVPNVAGSPVLMDILFSFDTTGSMYPCLSEVRRSLKETIQRLKRDIPGIRMAVIAHGDYCDRHIYVTKHIDFTSDDGALVEFVSNVAPTSGGDFDECYELVLRETHTQFSWREAAQKSLVMIGDATPHEPSYPLNVQNIDWRKECDSLKAKNIRVYAVQALHGNYAFYRQVANRTEGFYLKLDQFSSIVNFIMAICYREQGPEQLQNFETEVHLFYVRCCFSTDH